MTIGRRPSPFGELLSLRQAMDRLLEDSFVRPGGWGGFVEAATFPIDAVMTPNELVVEAALPGVGPDDVQITVERGTLTISATVSARRPEGEVLVEEVRRGRLSRTLVLPEGLEADRAEARIENGILSLRIPKAERIKPHQIRITPTRAHESTERSQSPSGGQG